MLIEKNVDGNTPLHLASKYGKMAVVDLLINYSIAWPIDIESQEGVPLKMVNDLGNAALHEAITHGKSEVALRLLQADHDVGHKLNRKNESPLDLGAKEGMSEVVREILRHPLVEIEEEMQTTDTGSPLHQAVLGGHIKIVAMLLYHRGDFVKKIDSATNNALHYAAQTDNARIMEMLLNKDLPLAYLNNKESQTPLHVAALYGSTSSIQAILKHCPDTAEQFAPNGGNALHLAVSRGKVSSVKCLDKRVDLCKLNNKGQTARSVTETMHGGIYNRFVAEKAKYLQSHPLDYLQLQNSTPKTTILN
ncbi:hypothetical protein LUZ60_010695 [Juncus effusus]|nr:hypothetical protein LUZ60_010695 [Juncus effusus]